MGHIYDRIGAGYTGSRREDPRIAAHIAAALGSACSVVNVGAGAGAYEPKDRRVVAVEPSPVMLAQRPTGAAPAVQAMAEALPFATGAFGAGMAFLTVHHWADKNRGLAELRRVTSGPIAIFSGYDKVLNTTWWLHEYFPASRRLVAGRIASPVDFAAILGPVTMIPVMIPGDCLDGFEAAYWRRPEAILDPAVWQASSALSMITDSERDAGMTRLAADLASGAWHSAHGHLLELSELDLGYRILLSTSSERIGA